MKIRVWKFFFHQHPSAGGMTSFWPPKTWIFNVFTFFDFLSPLTSFKPSKTYIGVNQNENWSIRAYLFNGLFLVSRQPKIRVGRSVKKNKLKYFLFYFYFLFFQISKNRVGRIPFFSSKNIFWRDIPIYSIAMIQIKDQLI